MDAPTPNPRPDLTNHPGGDRCGAGGQGPGGGDAVQHGGLRHDEARREGGHGQQAGGLGQEQLPLQRAPLQVPLAGGVRDCPRNRSPKFANFFCGNLPRRAERHKKWAIKLRFHDLKFTRFWERILQKQQPKKTGKNPHRQKKKSNHTYDNHTHV